MNKVIFNTLNSKNDSLITSNCTTVRDNSLPKLSIGVDASGDGARAAPHLFMVDSYDKMSRNVSRLQDSMLQPSKDFQVGVSIGERSRSQLSLPVGKPKINYNDTSIVN